jgi:hypothetical protein
MSKASRSLSGPSVRSTFDSDWLVLEFHLPQNDPYSPYCPCVDFTPCESEYQSHPTFALTCVLSVLNVYLLTEDVIIVLCIEFFTCKLLKKYIFIIYTTEI